MKSHLQPIVVMNWKMNPGTYTEARTLAHATARFQKSFPGIVYVAPPVPFLYPLVRGVRSLRYVAQGVHEESQGAHTGGVSVSQVQDAGACGVLIGHAEQRAAGETNEQITQKVSLATRSGLSAIVCVGESVRDSSGEYLLTVREQITAAVSAIQPRALKQLCIAYEPVWAIGADTPMGTHDMHEMSLYIRKILSELFGKTARVVPVLYGGSIDAETARNMMLYGDVQGVLVGRASIDPVKVKDLLTVLSTV